MQQYLVKPGAKVDLSEWDPNDTGDFKGGKKEGLAKMEKLNTQLEELQELLFAEHQHRVLIVLQAMDTGGKDGTIRRVFEGVNPSGVKIPVAGKNRKSGQNPDGFYQLLGRDNCDANPAVYLADTGSAFIAGPFTSRTFPSCPSGTWTLPSSLLTSTRSRAAGSERKSRW